MSKVVIGLSGKAEHGKSACSHIMAERARERGLSAQIFEVSHYIYRHCVHLGLLPDGLTRDQMTNAQVAVLVSEGSRMRNEVDPNYWTKIVLERIGQATCDVAICPNVRFPQEADGIRSIGGVIVRLTRLHSNGRNFVSTTRDPNHETETALDNYQPDFRLLNISGLTERLQKEVKALLDRILYRNNQGIKNQETQRVHRKRAVRKSQSLRTTEV